MVGIFINPGVFPDKLDGKGKPASNRNFEYDTLSDQYVRFLEKEILPTVTEKHKLNLRAGRRRPRDLRRLVGRHLRFTAAWERPDLFSKVLSHIGSFTNIRGGDRLSRHRPRRQEKRHPRLPARRLQRSRQSAGNWYLANLQMESALKFKGYDVKAVWGDGRHSGIHGGSILPDSMRLALARDARRQMKKHSTPRGSSLAARRLRRSARNGRGHWSCGCPEARAAAACPGASGTASRRCRRIHQGRAGSACGSSLRALRACTSACRGDRRRSFAAGPRNQRCTGPNRGFSASIQPTWKSMR